MKKSQDTGIPEFRSLQEEREYWEARGPLAEGHSGRVNKPRQDQKRSSFLVVRRTGEELTRLRDIAAKQGLGPSTFARLVLTRAISRDGDYYTTTDDVLGKLADKVSRMDKQRFETLLETLRK